MEQQQSFSDMEYQDRRITRREAFLSEMNVLLPWKNWAAETESKYVRKRNIHRAIPAERMLRMLMLSRWFRLSAEATEEAVYDSYCMKSFLGISFSAGEQVPDATTLNKFRRFLIKNGLLEKITAEADEILYTKGLELHTGSIVSASLQRKKRRKAKV